jgi:hypothetical protein
VQYNALPNAPPFCSFLLSHYPSSPSTSLFLDSPLNTSINTILFTLDPNTSSFTPGFKPLLILHCRHLAPGVVPEDRRSIVDSWYEEGLLYQTPQVHQYRILIEVHVDAVFLPFSFFPTLYFSFACFLYHFSLFFSFFLLTWVSLFVYLVLVI